MKKVFFMMSLAIMTLCFSSCGNNGNTPEGVVTEYLTLLQKGEVANIIDLFHFNQELTQEGKDGLVTMLEQKVMPEMTQKGGIESFEINDVEYADDAESAVVTYTIKYGDGTEEAETQKVLKIDGTWKLDSGK